MKSSKPEAHISPEETPTVKITQPKLNPIIAPPVATTIPPDPTSPKEEIPLPVADEEPAPRILEDGTIILPPPKATSDSDGGFVRTLSRTKIQATVLSDGKPVKSAFLKTGILKDHIPDLFRMIDRTEFTNSEGIGTAELSYSLELAENDDLKCSIVAYHPELGSAYGEYFFKDLAEGITLELEKGHTLKGLVVDANGSPLAGARVELVTSWTNEGVPMGLMSIYTNPDGTFTMAGIRFENSPLGLTVIYGDEPDQVEVPYVGQTDKKAIKFTWEERLAKKNIANLIKEGTTETDVGEIRLPMQSAKE